MAHYFDVISWGIKQMHAQFSLFFGLHNAMVLMSKLSWQIKLNIVEDNPEKTLRKNLMATPFSYINDASVDLNEVCLHISYLFLKELVFVSDVRFSPRSAVPWEFAFIAGSGIKSLFTGIDSSSDTAVSSTQLIYSFMPFFICLFILLSLLTYFFFESIAWTFFHGFRIPIPWFRFHFRIPDSMFQCCLTGSCSLRLCCSYNFLFLPFFFFFFPYFGFSLVFVVVVFFTLVSTIKAIPKNIYISHFGDGN